MDRRRAAAAALFAAGASGADVARALGVSRATASRWRRRSARRPRGRKPKLPPAALARVHAALADPPRAHGFDLDRWSLAAIAALIERATGARYHHRHVPRLLRRAGWLVPPAGPHAPHARRAAGRVRDPDGTALTLFVHLRG